MTRNEFIAETAARFAVSRPFKPHDACIDEAERLADSLEARGFAPWQSAPALPDEDVSTSDEIRNLREEVSRWRVKAEAYGGMVHGCSPVFERIGFPIESHNHGGRVGGIARAAEAIGAEMERLRNAPALTDAARRVVEAAVAAYDDWHDLSVRVKLWDAVRAYKESAK